MVTQSLVINLSFWSDQPTGITVYAQNLLPSLKVLDPTLVTPKPLAEYNCVPLPNNKTVAQGLKGHLDRLIWTQLQLPKISQGNHHLIFSPIPEAPLFSPCRYVVTVHDLIPLRYPKPVSPLTAYFKFYIPQVLKQAEHIICNSQATADDIINFWGISASKITPILLAYDQNHFYPAPTANDHHYFLYLGRADRHKNLPRLITAFSQFSRNHPEYQLWFAGPTDKRYTPQLKQQIEDLGLRDRAHFLNYIPYSQLPEVISNATALVFPTLWEGFGLPVLEAMGCGTPVITSNCSSLPEVAGDAAILIDPTQTQEITEAMNQIANNADLRSRLREKGLQRAAQFSWEKTGQATLEVLKQFL
ncbi:MAG: glycosyltransferase family 4 protein [Halothece sp.]